MKLNIHVNGEPREVDVDPDTPLLWVLREELHLTGTRFGCGAALCGACTVHVDGTATRSCVLPVGDLGDRRVRTIEGLGGAHPVQRAWCEASVPQCGYCQSGQVMAAVALLSACARPTREDIDLAMSGNICRCGTYPRIRLAIERAARAMAETSAPAEGAQAKDSP
jgi:isoquinoline 1-oxidoreductase alpha subunit